MKTVFSTLSMICGLLFLGVAGGMDADSIGLARGIEEAIISLAGCVSFGTMASRTKAKQRREFHARTNTRRAA